MPGEQFLTHAQAEWRRFDLYINGDPWAAARLRRCARRVNFFHGVAGKYDLDQPSGLPLGFEYYDHVAFINRDRMLRYLAADIVTPQQAVLVGYPKLDKLASGGFDGTAVRASLGLRAGADRALRADLLGGLLAAPRGRGDRPGAGRRRFQRHREAARSVARSGSALQRRHRLARALPGAGENARPGRVRFVESPDSSPLLAAADCMVTDHSSVGFEYLVLDRPLIVFDAPDLPRAARINPEKVVLLRSAATVVGTTAELTAAALRAMEHPAHLSAARRRVARALFFDPGRPRRARVELRPAASLHRGRSAEVV